jgi:oxygen-independent coproporphyrinogen-3 oxidase
MYPERYRSHHDAENALAKALGLTAHGRSTGVDWSVAEAALCEAADGSRRRCVYIHVPYCDRICNFCNLNRKERACADLDAYAQALIRQIEDYARYPYVTSRPFEAVYFGGGTPTVLDADHIGRVLNALRRDIGLSDGCEVTVESTLHNLPPAKAALLRQAGITRLSLGVQSFSARGRELLGRSYAPAAAIERLDGIVEAFAGTACLDLIYDYPGQTPEEAAADAERCAEAGAASVSFYPLMIHPGSRLGASIELGLTAFKRDLGRERELHDAVYGGLSSRGYELLELSKLAKPGKDEYRYIRVRYDNGDVLPVGVGAGGGLAGYRIYNPAPGARVAMPLEPRWERYHAALGLLQYGRYDPVALTRAMHSGDLPDAESQGRVADALADSAASLAERGLLEAAPDATESDGIAAPRGYRLTTLGIFWGNNAAVELLGAAAAAECRQPHPHKELSYA